MWKDKLKNFVNDACTELKDSCVDLKEKVEKAELGEKLKKAGENVKEKVDNADIGGKLKKAGETVKEKVDNADIGGKLKKAGDGIKAQFKSGGSQTTGADVVVDVPATVTDVTAENEPAKQETETTSPEENSDGGTDGTD